MRERWLVVWDCQSFGLANCIETLARDIECHATDIGTFSRTLELDPSHWHAWDRIIGLPALKTSPGFDSDMANVDLVPSLRFGGYHPDCNYVSANGEGISDGIVGPYHSMLAYAAYQEGLSAEQTARWFNADTFARLGYLTTWSSQRPWILEQYRRCGIDVSEVFRTAGRGRSFMHTINHPTIDALFEIAKALLTARGKAIFHGVAPPHDNLATTHWPVYPEIGELMAVSGSYLFKPANQHKPLDLLDYLDRSLAHFGRWPANELSVAKPLEATILTARNLMRGAI